MTRYEQAVAFWQGKKITTDAALAEALNGHSIAFAYHSGRMENECVTFNDTREIFEHDGVVSYTGDLRTLFEIRNARDANEFLLTSFRDQRRLDESLVKEFQRLLTQGTYDTRRWQLGERPGEYKKHDYVTGKNEIGAAAADVSEEMNELLSEMDNIPEGKVLTAAAYYHVKFENIHPFADGNGRTGRLTMNYFLLIHNHPPIIIHEEDRKRYYSALEAWDERQELAPMVEFLQDQTVRTWEKQIERTERKKNVRTK
ncbi:MAG: Fic family protein [Clostridia bacterium]|nr:Fic family protein [Clostridia bacterium]